MPLQDVATRMPIHSCAAEGATMRLSCPDGQAIAEVGHVRVAVEARYAGHSRRDTRACAR